LSWEHCTRFWEQNNYPQWSGTRPIIPDRTYYDLTAVEADPNMQGNPLGPLELRGIVFHRGLHGKSGVTGAQGVVLVGDGGAKEGHDAVAQHLVHRALVAVHGRHHVLERRVQEVLGGFGIKVADQFG
jgi:hypothetical protein